MSHHLQGGCASHSKGQRSLRCTDGMIFHPVLRSAAQNLLVEFNIHDVLHLKYFDQPFLKRLDEKGPQRGGEGGRILWDPCSHRDTIAQTCGLHLCIAKHK